MKRTRRKDEIEKNSSLSALSSFQNGEIVWAKLKKSQCLFWPAMVINHRLVGMKAPNAEDVIVYWFGDHRASRVPRNNVINFKTNFEKHSEFIISDKKISMPKLKEGIVEVMKVIAFGLNYDNLPERFDPFQNDHVNKVLAIFKLEDERIRINSIPVSVLKEIMKIKMLQPEIKYKSNSLCTDRYVPVMKSASKTRGHVLNASCLCCRNAITGPFKEHVFFEAAMCLICYEILNAVLLKAEEKNLCNLCTQNMEESLNCSKRYCNRNYCKECIVDFCGLKTWEKFSKKFICFLCQDYDESIRGKLKQKILLLRSDLKLNAIEPPSYFVPLVPECKESIRVLSLFDGISTGYYVLKKLNFSVQAYYAAEIDEDATSVSRFNFGDKITHIGDVTKIDIEQLERITPIDLVIGGSPCNDLSIVNPARKGLTDPEGTGILFFDFYRVLKELQLKNDGRHVFWLFENVARMDNATKALISRFFNMAPVHLNAKYLSPQERERCFWGNIPQLHRAADVLKNSDPSPSLDNHLITNLNRVAVVEKLRTITTCSNSLKQGSQKKDPILMDTVGDVPWIIELESVFGFPRHFTDVGELSVARRRRLIGKSWSVPVIESILKPLLNYFTTESN